MSESPLAARWRAIRADARAALIPYFTAGYPDPATARAALAAAAEAGADFVELGVPYSDPLADGPVIQRAAETALAHGMTVARTLALVRDARPPVPVVLMTYLNPVLAYGLERFLDDAAAAGVAGLLVTDLPAGADPALERRIAAGPLAFVRLVAPTSTDERLAAAAGAGSGFLYLISRLGVTGARDGLPADLPALVARARRATALPVAVGFGIGTGAQAAAAARAADGVVVGSALVAALGAGGVAAAARLVRELAAAVRAARGGRAA